MKNAIIGMLIFLCGLFAPPVFAADAFTIGVGTYAYMPFHRFENGQYSGFARDLLDHFSQKTGHTLEYTPLPWKRALREFKEEKLDFIFPDNPDWARDVKRGRDIHYSNVAVEYLDGIILLPENKGKGLDHLKTLGAIRGFSPVKYLGYIKSGKIRLSENSDFVPLLKQVLSQRVNGAYAEVTAANYYLREHLKKPGSLVFDPELPHTRNGYRLSSIAHPHIIQEFNRFLVEEKEAIMMLKKKYGITTEAE